jgi:putative ABC transport system substrate-binding protein
MKRREFITLAAGTASLLPFGARAQQSAMPAVGFLHVGSRNAFGHVVAAFHRGLAESDFVEGRNVAIEYRWAEGQLDRLPVMVADLMRLRVAVIAGAQQGLQAVKAAGVTVPSVFVSSEDPVKDVHEAGGRLGVQLVTARANSTQDIEAAFATFVQRRAAALLVGASPFFNNRRDLLVALAARHKLPAAYEWREFAAAGGLVSYGNNIIDVYRQAGVYAGRILKGAKPADLPVVQPAKFELVINVKTAKALGLTISADLLTLADEVIE